MPTEPKPDPLRARVEAILRESRGRVWIADRRGISDLDPETAADALMNLVGPLVAACRKAVGESTPYVSTWEFDPHEHPDVDPEKIHAEIVAALAAIDKE